MALKDVHVSDVPYLDQVTENVTLSLLSSRFNKGVNDEVSDDTKKRLEFPKFVVMGHRGSGMNMLQSSDQRMKSIKENSILSFNAASEFPIDFIEFDVQVTRDDCPVIFHDNFILTQHKLIYYHELPISSKGEIIEKRVTELSLAELLSYGPQKDYDNVGKPLFRKTKDGRIFEWKVEKDAPLCTLQEVFEEVDRSIGFNIELKFDDHMVYTEEELTHVLEVILKVVYEHGKDRPVIFSSFQPDATLLIRKLQSFYPVFFLTNGGSQTYTDVRRGSLDEAINVCLAGGLQGIVSEVKAILKNPGALKRIHESKLSLVTYGELNNVPEVVYVQHLMGIEGVIVDLVPVITEAIANFEKNVKKSEVEKRFLIEEEEVGAKSQFSKDELSLIQKLIPELIHI